jgi:hypothetical protein
MSSAGKRYSVMTEMQRKKHGFTYLNAKIAHLNKNNTFFKSETVCCEALANTFASLEKIRNN